MRRPLPAALPPCIRRGSESSTARDLACPNCCLGNVTLEVGPYIHFGAVSKKGSFAATDILQLQRWGDDGSLLRELLEIEGVTIGRLWRGLASRCRCKQYVLGASQNRGLAAHGPWKYMGESCDETDTSWVDGHCG